MPRLRYPPIAFALTTLFSAPSIAAETQIPEQNAQDDIVISASRVETKRIESGSSVTVLDEQYLKDNQARTVAEILQDVPGVSVSSTGGVTSVYIRGASSNQTLVIIDGVEVNDLSSITGGYNFSTLMADNIERIEVLKGSQSALWGSDAMGGVINIVTKKGQGALNGHVDFEFGGNKYKKQGLNINSAKGKSHYSFSASNLTTDGISSKTELTGGDETDAYENQTIALKAGHQLTDILSVDAVLRYNNAMNEYDNGDDASQNSDLYGETRQRLAKINTHINLLNKQWLNSVSLAYSDFYSKDTNSAYGNSVADGQKTKVDLQSHYYVKTIKEYSQRVSFIAEHENDKYQSWGMIQEDKMEASGIVLEYGADWAKKIFFTGAIRQDFNEKFEDTMTYHIDISAWASDGTRLHTSHGTGVKNPSFGQLYGYSPSAWGDYVGNPNLQPEKSTSWDAGIEYNFADADAYIDLTYFDSRYTDMHTYAYDSSYNGTYVNLDDEATSYGVELTGKVKVSNKLRVNAGYTYNKTSDGSTEDKQLVNRPKNTASINANYQYTEKLSANLGVRYVGERLGYGDTELSSYSIANIATAYQLNEHLSVYGRLENALDKDYVDVSGYNTGPLTAYIGFSFK